MEGEAPLLEIEDLRTYFFTADGLRYVAVWNSAFLQSRDLTEAVQAFMGDGSPATAGMVAYPSWRLDDAAGTRHAVHLGQEHTVNCPTLSIDGLAQQEGLSHLDFIKIDTDGHEYEILLGGRQSVERWRPIIVFEFCFYENEKRGHTFAEFSAFFSSLNYDICLSDKSTRIADETAARRVVPKLGSYDFVAVPR
jgi:FkbM family methyltransferase